MRNLNAIDPEFARAAIKDVRRHLLRKAIKRILGRAIELARFRRAD